MGLCQGISSLYCVWARASLTTSGWTSIPFPCSATGFSPTTLFPPATPQLTLVTYKLTTKTNHSLVHSRQEMSTACHVLTTNYTQGTSASTCRPLKVVIHSYQPSQMICCLFSSFPANRLQLSLSLSHSFSNGKTCRFVDPSLHGLVSETQLTN